MKKTQNNNARDNKELKDVVILYNGNEEIISGGNTRKVGLVLLL